MPGGENNPFFHRGPIRRHEFFFGRSDKVAQSLLLLRNGQNVSLVGQRRIGKTSLLFHIANPVVFETHGLRLGEHLFVYLDSNELGSLSPNEILSLWAGELEGALSAAGHALALPRLADGGMTYRAFRQVLLNAIESGIKPIFVLDEFESLAGNPYLDAGFFSGLRALSSQADFAFVTASRQSLLELTYANASALSSPFFNTFASMHLGLLSAREARGLVESLAAHTGLGLGSDLVQRILELAGPHPLLLQIAAFHAVELWGESGYQEAGDKEWKHRFLNEAEPHFAYYWHHLTAGERYALAALPLAQTDEAQREMTRCLERASLVRPTADKQALTYLSPAFEAFVRRQPVADLVQLGPFLLDIARQEAICHGAALKVTRTEFRALTYLLRHTGQVITPQELERALWADEYVEDPERVRAVIKSLRKALGDEADCLVTKWGVGYIFQISS